MDFWGPQSFFKKFFFKWARGKKFFFKTPYPRAQKPPGFQRGGGGIGWKGGVRGPPKKRGVFPLFKPTPGLGRAGFLMGNAREKFFPVKNFNFFGAPPGIPLFFFGEPPKKKGPPSGGREGFLGPPGDFSGKISRGAKI